MKLTNSKLFREACFINGKWIDANNKKTFSVVNPYDEKVIGAVPECGQTETEYAIKAAHDAFPSWASLTAKERAELLWKWAHLIDQNLEDLAQLMTLEGGKPIKEARAEIVYSNNFIKWYAEEGRRVYGDIIPSNNKNQHLLVMKQPVGVVGAITPWNFPSAMITRKCAPALTVGCTVVIKPAEETPFSALALAVLAEEAGFPKGVLNVITGIPEVIGKELTNNRLVRKISFTGSTAVGKLLMEQSSKTVKKISLELGGNAPFIVFSDADLNDAVRGAVACKFRNTGQTCVCANRILVENSIYDEFADLFTEAVKKLKLGNGLDDQVDIGPLINAAGIKKVEHHVKDAVEKGAKIVLGGKRATIGSLFYEPTVLTEVTSDMLVATEETFGPVAPLFRFNTEDEAIHMANDTPFGLASYFYGRDIKRIWDVAAALEYGIVGINTGIISSEVAPFGGIKESGIGREGSKYGLDEYLEIKYLCMG